MDDEIGQNRAERRGKGFFPQDMLPSVPAGTGLPRGRTSPEPDRLGSKRSQPRIRLPYLLRKLMCENVLLGPAFQVEQGARRQEIEAALRQFGAPLARQHLVESGAQRMQIAHIPRGV